MGNTGRSERPPRAYIYFPQAQRWDAAMAIHVRTNGDPTALAPIIRAEVAAIDADLPVSDVRTMNSHLGIALLPARLAGTVLGVFGALGLLLAAVGMYGVMSYSVSQRRREIGIRVAIGAARGQVLGLVMRQGLWMVAVGTAIGLVGALAGARLVRGMLYGETGYRCDDVRRRAARAHWRRGVRDLVPGSPCSDGGSHGGAPRRMRFGRFAVNPPGSRGCRKRNAT